MARERKEQDIETAARALFELMKVAVVELEDAEWETIPARASESNHQMRCREHYVKEVKPVVEALWRAGRLT